MAESSELQEFRKNYYNMYQNYLVPIVSKFDTERKWSLVIAIILTIVLCLVGGFVSYVGIKNNEKGTTKFGILIFCIGCSMYYMFKKGFEAKIKEKIMGKVCKCFGNMTWYDYYNGNHRFFSESGAIPAYTNVDDDDVFIGTYKDVNILVAESEYEVGNGKDRSTVFKGVVIKLDMNKNFNGHTVVCSDTLMHKSPLPSLKRTELEDVEFEKKYDVFTNDPVDARYVLTPTFMDKIKNIEVAFSCKKIRCAFYQESLVIAMTTKTDLFSIGSLIRPVADTKQFEDLLNQFVSILALIDILKLNEEAVL